MSFSSDVKKELAGLLPEKTCCRAAEAYGLLQMGHAFTGGSISLQTENDAVAGLYTRLVPEICGIPPLTAAAPPEMEKRKAYYIVTVEEEAQRRRVLERFGHTAGEVTVRLNRANLECDDCAAAYLRGAFLSCGAVTDPKADDHMEFSVPTHNLSRDLMALLGEQDFSPRMVRRAGGNVVYFKESEQIEDILTLMGAQDASLELMNIKILKDIRNKANRITNCESANIDKTVAAAAVHVEAVRKIQASCGLEALPEELRELARLRLEHPEISLRELSDLLPERLSRSGVNHRLRRIVEFADKLS